MIPIPETNCKFDTVGVSHHYKCRVCLREVVWTGGVYRDNGATVRKWLKEIGSRCTGDYGVTVVTKERERIYAIMDRWVEGDNGRNPCLCFECNSDSQGVRKAAVDKLKELIEEDLVDRLERSSKCSCSDLSSRHHEEHCTLRI